jgi:UPF0271 protein
VSQPDRLVIDLACDLGEGAGYDGEILPQVTSASIACGLHAGDPSVMAAALILARRHGVAVGAHPGFADRAGFGRADVALPAAEVHHLVAYQLGALAALARPLGLRLQHCKPHGALYHQAATRPEVAAAVAAAVREHDARLIVVGQAGTCAEAEARRLGLRFAAEAFVDRGYDDAGGLLPRSHPAALLAADPQAIGARALGLVARGELRSQGGVRLAVRAQTLCLHGDDLRAPARARALREALEAAGVSLVPLGAWL